MFRLFLLSLVLGALNLNLAHAGDSFSDALAGDNEEEKSNAALAQDAQDTRKLEAIAPWRQVFVSLEKAKNSAELLHTHRLLAQLGSGQEVVFINDLYRYTVDTYLGSWTDQQMEKLLWSLPRIMAKMPNRSTLSAGTFSPIIELIETIFHDCESSVINIRAAQTLAELAILFPQHEDLKNIIDLRGRSRNALRLERERLTEEYVDSQARARAILVGEHIAGWLDIATQFISGQEVLDEEKEGRLQGMLWALMVDMDLTIEDVQNNALMKRNPDLALELHSKLERVKKIKRIYSPNYHFFSGAHYSVEEGVHPRWTAWTNETLGSSLANQIDLRPRSASFREKMLERLIRTR